jgi:peptidoglycan/LPS O-acetylase OafA/YrhL
LKPKIEEIQYLRAFAFLAVVLQHSVGHYVGVPEIRLQDGVLMGVLLLLAKFAVPMFIFISGLVLFYNYDGGRIAYVPFVRKRCRDILLPYVPWALLYIGINQSFPRSVTDIGRAALDLLTGTASYHLWYIIMIFQVYLWFPLLQPTVLRIDRRLSCSPSKFGIAALVALGLFYVWYTGVRGAFSAAVGSLPIPIVSDLFTTYDDRNALHFFYYFILGAAAGLHLQRWQATLDKFRGVLRFGYGAITCVLLYVIVSHFRLIPALHIDYNDTILIQPLMAAFLIVSVIAMHAEAMAFASRASNFLRAIMNRVGALSYSSYLAHALVLSAAEWAADWLLPGCQVTLRMLIAFALCAAGSVGVAYLLGLGKTAIFGLPRPKPAK